jgi:SSS family solute:Na+ symporter
MFSTDIVSHYLGKDRLSEKQHVLLARVFIVLIVAATYYLSLQGYKSVFAMGVWCFSGFASLFPLVFAAIYWKRLTAAGAIAGVLATVACGSYLFYRSDFGANRTYTVDVLGYQTMPVVTIFACSLVAMVVVSLITAPPSDDTLEKFFPKP